MSTTWQTKKLDDACEVEYGTRVVNKKHGGSKYPVYGGGGATFFMDRSNRKDRLVIARFAMSEQCTRFVSGEFFLNDSGLTLSPKNNHEISQDFLDWEMLFLNDHIYSLARGSAQKNLDVPAFRKIDIIYPESIQEQRRIVKKLDEVFEKITKAKEAAEKNLQNSKELFESFLQNVFANPGKDWDEKKLKEICEELFAGGDVPKKNSSKVMTDKYIVPIYANGVKNKGLYGYTNIPRVIKPSVTISARGTIGYSEIRNEAYFPVVRLIVLVPNPTIVNVHYLYYITRSFSFSNTGTSIPQLTIPMVENLKIALPPLKEQRIIVEKLERLSAETKKLQKIYEQKITDIEELKKSILSKAFHAEL